MNLFDLIILIPLLVGAYKGFRDGLIIEVFSLLALILGIIGGFKLLHVVMEFMQEEWGFEGTWLPFIAFLLIFIGIILLTNIAGKALSKLINITALGVFDKLGGAVLAVFKYALGLSVLIWILDKMDVDLPAGWISDSVVYPYLEPLAQWMWDLIAVIFPVATDFFEKVRDYTLE